MKSRQTIYFNVKAAYTDGVETVDELCGADFASPREFWGEVRRLVTEYRVSGTPVYTSSRATREWAENQRALTLSQSSPRGVAN